MHTHLYLYTDDNIPDTIYNIDVTQYTIHNAKQQASSSGTLRSTSGGVCEFRVLA